MQKTVKSKIYTPFLTLGEPPWDFRKTFAAKRWKWGLRKPILTPTPSDPPPQGSWLAHGQQEGVTEIMEFVLEVKNS